VAFGVAICGSAVRPVLFRHSRLPYYYSWTALVAALSGGAPAWPFIANYEQTF